MDFPAHYKHFMENYPEIHSKYDELGRAVHNSGPLDKKTRELIKLAISVGARYEGAAHSATRKALEAGATKDELRQVVFLSLTTCGFPTMMAALSWLEDIIGKD